MTTEPSLLECETTKEVEQFKTRGSFLVVPDGTILESFARRLFETYQVDTFPIFEF